MPVHDDGVPFERLPARGNLVHVMAELRVLALSERIDIDDGAEIVELVVDRDIGGFPDRSFGHFAIAEQHVRAVFGADPPRVQRRADRGADPLPERAGRDVDKGQAWRRMPFQIRVDAAQLQQLLAREQPCFSPGRVEDGRGVSL